jgi:hypothetical protein
VPGRDGERDYSHRSRIDKLGVKPGMLVVAEGVDELLPELAERDARLVDDAADVVFLRADTRDELVGVPAAWARAARPRGALWIVYPKGVRSVTENDVLAAGRAAGLLDVKVVSFSPTHTALRFVAPRAER